MTIVLQAPPSKSVSHRLMIGAALAPGVSTVRHILECTDLERTRTILADTGAQIASAGDFAWQVTGMSHGPVGGNEAPIPCDVQDSGTTCRLLAAVLACGQGAFSLRGTERMHERPLGALLEALTTLGARITCTQQKGHLPLRLDAQGLDGGEITLKLDESSQYLSGLLLAAPLCRQSLCITLEGSKIVSWPYVGLTLQTLEAFGINFSVETLQSETWQTADWRTLHDIRPGELRITVHPGSYRAGDYTGEGDWSGASYLLAAGAIGRNPVCVAGLRTDSIQGDRAMLTILHDMGAQLQTTAGGILVSPSTLQGITVDMGTCPDLVPTVAVLGAFASGITRITHVEHLRIKESDRIAAPAAELRKVGVRVDEHDDGLTIYGLGPDKPSIPAGTLFSAHDDHRIAMSLALLGLHGDAVTLDRPEVVRKSFPHFWQEWSKLSCLPNE